jgi:hypothetical protein
MKDDPSDYSRWWKIINPPAKPPQPEPPKEPDPPLEKKKKLK